jgi:hypothetical protein
VTRIAKQDLERWRPIRSHSYAEAAKHNAEICWNLGYDFGYCSPGSITELDDGRYEVCIPWLGGAGKMATCAALFASRDVSISAAGGWNGTRLR